MDEIQKLRLQEKQDDRYTLVKLNIPGGYICGKWWGPKNIRPFLCLHGWMDNCGVYDRLIPLLPKEFGYLAFDLPGHGISSKYPQGMTYSLDDTVVLIERIRMEYNWDKVSLIGHSLTGICGFFYATMFPDKLDMFVALDNVMPYVTDLAVFARKNIDRFFKEEARIVAPYQSEPPSYTYEELIEKISVGSQDSIDKENAKYLLTRNVKRSSKFPGKYYFNFDGRIKGYNRGSRTIADTKVFAKYLNCPVLHCIGRDSYMTLKDNQDNSEIHNYFKEMGKDVTAFEGPGNHHFFLTHPEAFAGAISDFIRRNRKLPNKL